MAASASKWLETSFNTHPKGGVRTATSKQMGPPTKFGRQRYPLFSSKINQVNLVLLLSQCWKLRLQDTPASHPHPTPPKGGDE